jgi:predicted small secreted protein
MTVCTQFVRTLLVFAIAGIIASGCNTFKGAGKDIQKGGEAVENAAESVEEGK